MAMERPIDEVLGVVDGDDWSAIYAVAPQLIR
jgi:hypothetical protein